ncbi:cation:proton antiporter [Pengzhenrongella phosphoraccumulans]|uniref:cation:proton antiporter domain-containing protein n=1 Tax=Pengzhenrongella phosphoraccumulans TaxID=3114394 RepID=UPI00388D6987
MNGLTILAVVFAAYALVAGYFDRHSITAPMVFVVAGGILGSGGTGLWEVSLSNETGLAITEITLALLLFADAATVRFRDVEDDASLPSRLLFIGLPLTVALGAVLAYLMEPGAGWAAAALVATILAPTDAALGLAVVTNRAVPARIRRALNVESGLNDGLATPFVTLFLAMVISEESSGTQGWVVAALSEIGLAMLAAAVVGLGGGWLVSRARSHGWTSAVSEQLAVLALAVLAYTGSVALGGNGFVAAFLGGLLFGQATKGRLDAPVEFTETVGLFLSFLVWALFGAVCVGPMLTGPTSWTAIAYAVLSLTVVRMLPVGLSLLGLGLHRETWLFMGWFGPRGLASVVFTLVVFGELEPGSVQITPLVQVATWTILLSVVAHGLTAGPWAARYGARRRALGEVPELAPAGEQRVRTRALSRPRSHDAGSVGHRASSGGT